MKTGIEYVTRCLFSHLPLARGADHLLLALLQRLVHILTCLMPEKNLGSILMSKL